MGVQEKYLEIVTQKGAVTIFRPDEWDDIEYDGRAIIVRKDQDILAVYNFAKLFSVKRRDRESVENEYERGIPAYADVLEILENAKNDEKSVWEEITVTEFMEMYTDTLRGYNAKQIGQALNACGAAQREKRNHQGRTARVRLLPVPIRGGEQE